MFYFAASDLFPDFDFIVELLGEVLTDGLVEVVVFHELGHDYLVLLHAADQ